MSEIKAMIIEKLTNILDALPLEWMVLIMSCFPVVELRGSIPFAMASGMSFWQAFTLGVIGNMLPVLPLLILFRPLSDMLLRYSWYRAFYEWLYHRAMRKSKNVERFGAFGLILFTAIPLPTTGAWTACIAASFLGIRMLYAFLAIFTGVVIAGFIMGLFSYSLFG